MTGQAPDASGAGSSPRPAEASRSRILFYAMYDTRGLDKAPKVRIERLAAALRDEADVVLESGGRWARIRSAARWAIPGRWRTVDAVYVESASSAAMPWDLLVLVAARAAGRPVGVYFRDAYQLFRDEYPLVRRRQHLADWLWRLTNPLLMRLATVRFAPSAGLARALGLRDPVSLPPGTDPELPDLGWGREPLVAYVGGLGKTDGFDLLVEAMGLVRHAVPEARLLVVGPPPRPGTPELPKWVELRQAGRDQLPALLAPVRVAVIPRLITPYTNLAVPIKLMDYLGFGKPIVATAAEETAKLLEGAGLLVRDEPPALSDALVRVLTDDALAADLARGARTLAETPAWTWHGTARRLLAALVPRAVDAATEAADAAAAPE